MFTWVFSGLILPVFFTTYRLYVDHRKDWQQNEYFIIYTESLKPKGSSKGTGCDYFSLYRIQAQLDPQNIGQVVN